MGTSRTQASKHQYLPHRKRNYLGLKLVSREQGRVSNPPLLGAAAVHLALGIVRTQITRYSAH